MISGIQSYNKYGPIAYMEVFKNTPGVTKAVEQPPAPVVTAQETVLLNKSNRWLNCCLHTIGLFLFSLNKYFLK